VKIKYILKSIFLKNVFTREIMLFIFNKKVYKKIIDRKIARLPDLIPERKEKNLIVSLTSFPERIPEIKYTLFSLLDQTLRPEKIVLWLTESQFPLKEMDLPPELLKFTDYGVEIRWYNEDIRSYTKLIPSLEYYPDAVIVIADDDIYYRKDWLRKLWETHQKYPDDVICHVANKIIFNSNNTIAPYKKWKMNIRVSDTSLHYFPLGVGGVLYQKWLLFEDIYKKELYLKLAPYADDIWFYFMIILNNTRVRVVKNPYTSLKFVNPYREYNLITQYRLSSINVDNGQNDIQLNKVLGYYKIDLHQSINMGYRK
jgi:GTPase SAR1 family protein